MANSISINLSSKTCLNSQDRGQSHLQPSENLRAQTPFASLPLELWEIVASYLTKEDLKNLSCVSLKCKSGALSAQIIQKNHQGLKDFEALAHVKPQRPQNIVSLFDVFQDFLADIHDMEILAINPNLAIDLSVLPQLKQTLKALHVNQVIKKYVSLTQKSYQEIDQSATKFEDIELKYHQLESSFILQAFNATISSTILPEETRGFAAKKAAEHGYRMMAMHLLESGNISIIYKSWSIKLAADMGHPKIIEFFLKRGSVSYSERSVALQKAAKKGHFDIVKILLEYGEISQNDRNSAIQMAAQNGHLEVIEILLEPGEISDLERGAATSLAAENGHLEVVKTLLASGMIDNCDRGSAATLAAEKGYVEIVKTLVSSGEIANCFKERMILTAHAQCNLHIMQVLLPGENVSDYLRALALKSAASNGDVALVQNLLAGGFISDEKKTTRKISSITSYDNHRRSFSHSLNF